MTEPKKSFFTRMILFIKSNTLLSIVIVSIPLSITLFNLNSNNTIIKNSGNHIDRNESITTITKNKNTYPFLVNATDSLKKNGYSCWDRDAVFKVISCDSVRANTIITENNQIYYLKHKNSEAVLLKRVFPFYEGVRRVQVIGGKYGYTKDDSTFLIPPMWDLAYDFSDGLALVSNAGEYHYYNLYGKKEFSPPEGYSEAFPFYDKRARIKMISGKFQFINTEGHSVFDFEILEAGDFSKGLAPVKIKCTRGQSNNHIECNTEFSGNDKNSINLYFGYIDKEGNFEIKPKDLHKAFPFNKYGIAYVRPRKSKWYFIDLKGNKIPQKQPYYLSIGELDNGFFRAQDYRDTSKYFVLNARGETVSPQVQSVKIAHNLIVFKRNNRMGIMNLDGGIVVEPKYDSIHIVSPRIFVLGKAKKYTTMYYSRVQNKLNYLCEKEADTLSKDNPS